MNGVRSLAGVLAHKAGEVFRVDVPENEWSYVVRREDPDRTVPVHELVRLP